MNAYFFDVDGVLTNLGQVINPELVKKLSHILMNSDMLGLISGRGFDWQVENVVKPIEMYVNEHSERSKELIDNFFVSAEFGGASVLHKNGERIQKIDESIVLVHDLRKKLHDIADEFSNIVLVETDKKTMFSSPKKPSVALDAFNAIKSDLVLKYEDLVRNYPDLEIHTDRYSVNVKHKNATKRHATIEVLEWLEEKGVKPERYYAFGDSVSDLDIGEALFERNLPMEFVFVGQEEELKGHQVRFPYIVTKADFDEGTLEFLNK